VGRGRVGGVSADGWERRGVIMGASLACAAAVTLMLAGLSPGRYWVLYAALIAENSSIVLCAPAWQARIPAVVGTGPLLSSAGALNATSSGIVRLIGGPLGGVLLAVAGIRWLICAGTATFLLPAGARTPPPRAGRGAPRRR